MINKSKTAMHRRQGYLSARRPGLLLQLWLHKRWGLLLSFVFALLLLFMPLPPQAGVLHAAGEDDLLKEIAEQIEKYYLFAPEKEVELETLDDLPLFWQDPHSTYLPPEQFKDFTDSLSRSLNGIGVYLEKGERAVTVVSPVPGTPAYRAGIKSGDLIYFVDGRNVIDSALETVVTLLRGKGGTTVTVTVKRGKEFLTFSLVREQINLPNLEHVMLEGELALLRIYNFDSGVAQETSRLLSELEEAGVRGIILDLRANQGGYVDEALALADLFTAGVLLQVREKDMEWEQIEGTDTVVTAMPLVLLLNGGTASGSEIVAAALKDNGAALLLGENSFGKGTMQTVRPLQHGGYLKVTTAEFASPAQTMIEGSGVEPHFFVFDPQEQIEVAAMLLRNVLEQKKGQESYLELFMQHDEAGRGPLPQTLLLGGEPHYPLRALLTLTGRPIVRDADAGFYNFTWEGNIYRLDLKQKMLFRPDLPLDVAGYNVLLRDGTTYVPLSFLIEGLGLPYLH